VSLSYLPPTRREIVLALRRRGESRARDLAKALGISVGAIRQQLAALQSDGIVRCDERINGPGRPKHFYDLAPAADDLFRQDSRDLVRDLAEFVEHRAPEVMEEFIDTSVGRWEVKIPASAGDRTRELPDRLSWLARWLDDEGFMPTIRVARGSGGFNLTLHNCPLLPLVSGTTRVCDRTQAGMERVFGDCGVTRTEWRGAGDRFCTYRFEAGSGKQG
jgi:predicted ArsR family transcriptional regulator